MAGRRVTPSTEPDRTADRIIIDFPQIRDRETYDRAFNLFTQDWELSPKDEKNIREKTFIALRRRNKKIKSTSLFKDAGGKSFNKDKRTLAKTVVTTEKEYKRLGARRVDLKNYDTPSLTRKQKIVFAKREFVTVKGKQQLRFRDKKGRFVKKIK